METPFRALTFHEHETITNDKLDQLQGNLQWLNDNTPRGRFYAENGSAVVERMVLICGGIAVPSSKKETKYSKRVTFGKAFSPNCRPNVTTGLVSETKKIFVVTNGPGTLLPSSYGFDIRIQMSKTDTKNSWGIPKAFAVYWQACGFRTDDMHDF